MHPDDLRDLFDQAERCRNVREQMMDAAQEEAHKVARRVSDMMRDNGFHSQQRMDDLTRHVADYETAWLAYLAAGAEWKAAHEAYARAHEELSGRLRTS